MLASSPHDDARMQSPLGVLWTADLREPSTPEIRGRVRVGRRGRCSSSPPFGFQASLHLGELWHLIRGGREGERSPGPQSLRHFSLIPFPSSPPTLAARGFLLGQFHRVINRTPHKAQAIHGALGFAGQGDDE